MKDRNVYGKKMTQYTRRHKHVIVCFHVIWCGIPVVIKCYHGYKIFLYRSNDTFTELVDYAEPMTKAEFVALVNDYALNPKTRVDFVDSVTIY